MGFHTEFNTGIENGSYSEVIHCHFQIVSVKCYVAT